MPCCMLPCPSLGPPPPAPCPPWFIRTTAGPLPGHAARNVARMSSHLPSPEPSFCRPISLAKNAIGIIHRPESCVQLGSEHCNHPIVKTPPKKTSWPCRLMVPRPTSCAECAQPAGLHETVWSQTLFPSRRMATARPLDWTQGRGGGDSEWVPANPPPPETGS